MRNQWEMINSLGRSSSELFISIFINGGARGIVVIVVGNGHGNTSSNPQWDWLHFT